MAKAKGGSTTSMKVSFGKKSKGKAKKNTDLNNKNQKSIGVKVVN